MVDVHRITIFSYLVTVEDSATISAHWNAIKQCNFLKCFGDFYKGWFVVVQCILVQIFKCLAGSQCTAHVILNWCMTLNNVALFCMRHIFWIFVEYFYWSKIHSAVCQNLDLRANLSIVPVQIRIAHCNLFVYNFPDNKPSIFIYAL